MFREKLIDAIGVSHRKLVSPPDTQTGCQQGRSERRRESYGSVYVERLNEARTMRAA